MVTAILPGSSDSPADGYLDLLERVLRMFDRVPGAVLLNGIKDPLFAIGLWFDRFRQRLYSERTVAAGCFGVPVIFADDNRTWPLVKDFPTVPDSKREEPFTIIKRERLADIETVFLMAILVYFSLGSRL